MPASLLEDSLFQPGIRSDQQQPYLRLHCVNIYVRDQDRSVRFYVDELGFSLLVDESIESVGRWVAVAPPDGMAVLALVTPKRNSEEFKLIGRSRHAVFVTEDVVGKYHDWRKRGVQFQHPPQATLWGGMFTRFSDPDGNSFALVGRDDFVREIEAQRRALSEKQEAERRAAQELEIAKQVQARLFPQILPPVETLDYAGVCIQARAVGGDYYDFLNLGEGRLGIIISDIAGKGIAAALLMANLQANLRSQSAIALRQLPHFLESVNGLFFKNTTESAYASLFLAQYDEKTGRLLYANCGHYAPLLLRADNTLERLDSTSTVLGLFPDWQCSVAERQLFPGDILLLYTDGITESFNERGEEFGEHRLAEALRKHHALSPQLLLAAIMDEVERYSPREQSDDRTLIAARCRT
jgi:serine phosphatase RsbU (regulator of sigma subunit)/predicted enzyme related to lactoylglutathione lyase